MIDLIQSSPIREPIVDELETIFRYRPVLTDEGRHRLLVADDPRYCIVTDECFEGDHAQCGGELDDSQCGLCGCDCHRDNKPAGHFDVQYFDGWRCWCGGQDGAHNADATTREGRW